LFFIYILQVSRFTIFPIPIFSPTIREISSKIDILSTINIKPFANITLNRQFYYNILLTIPFGFLLPLLRNKSIKKVLLKGYIQTNIKKKGLPKILLDSPFFFLILKLDFQIIINKKLSCRIK
jgi:glycopeptide antibiotics resistance protein